MKVITIKHKSGNDIGIATLLIKGKKVYTSYSWFNSIANELSSEFNPFVKQLDTEVAYYIEDNNLEYAH